MSTSNARNHQTSDPQTWTSISTRRASGWIDAAQRHRATARLPHAIHEDATSPRRPSSPFLRLVHEMFDGMVQAAGFGLLLALFLLTIYLMA